MKLFHKYFLCSILVFGFCISFVYGWMMIPNIEITENTIWTKDGGPHIIGTSVTINPGVVLSIEAGTVVKFDHDKSLDVLGSLIVNGTSDEKVYFTSFHDDSVGGDTDIDDPSFDRNWTGIQVLSGGSVELNNLTTSYAQTCFAFFSATGSFDKVGIDNCQNGINASESIINIINANISNNNNGIISFNSDIKISNSSIFDNLTYSILNDSIDVGVSTINAINNWWGDEAGPYYQADSNASTTPNQVSVNIVYDPWLIYNPLNIQTTLSSSTETENDKVQDSKGVVNNTIFTFGITYTNTGNIIPDYVRIIIEVFGQASSTIEFDLVADGNDFTNGEIYTATSTFSKGNYIYYFESKVGDNIIKTATSSFITGYDSVLFIPGLEASRLYKTDDSGNEKRIWEPGVFHDNSELFLTSEGKSIRSDVYTRDIIDNAYLPIKGNIYESFISSMEKMKTDELINDWKAVPYDWRLSLDDLLSSGKEYPDGKIYYAGELGSTSDPYIIGELRRLASSSATGKVTIIAHSNGGLITKELANKLGAEASELIDQIIFVAVPQAGTPAALGALLHGFQTGLPKDWLPIFISTAESRELGQNMSSAHNLLSFSKYFNYVSSPIITFDNSALLTSWRAKYGSEINSGAGLYNFLSDQSREVLPTKSDLVSVPTLNKYLLDSAKDLHDNKIDNWAPPEGIFLTEIAGWGEDTLSGIKYYQGIKTECTNPNIFSTCSINSQTPVLEYNPIITYEGDGTVVVPSALWTASSTSVSKYWVDLNDYNIYLIRERGHADIFEVPELRSFIQNIISQNNDVLPKYISTSTPIKSDLEKRLHFTLHSPLSLDLYDEQGNHTGISTTTNELEENIPGSRYITFGEVKYISVPASSTINVSMRGYSSGSFTLNIEEVQGNNIIASTTFAGVPSSTSTIATINIPNGNILSTTPLVVDINGDGQQDITISLKIGEIAVPDFLEEQINSGRRRRSVNFAATSSELFTDKYDIGSTTIVSVFANEVKQSRPESFVVAVTTSTPVFTSAIPVSASRGKQSKSEQLSSKAKIDTLTNIKSSNSSSLLTASVGNIPFANNIIQQVISFIKNIIDKVFLWYNW